VSICIPYGTGLFIRGQYLDYSMTRDGRARAIFHLCSTNITFSSGIQFTFWTTL